VVAFVAEDDALERLHFGDATGDAQRDRLRPGIHAATGGGQVLRCECALQIDGAQVVSAHFHWIHAHVDLTRAAADDRHLAHARDALDLASHAFVRDFGDLADRLLGAQGDQQHRRRLRIDLAHDRRVGAARQIAEDVADLVAHVGCRDLGRFVDFEGDCDLREALTRGGAELVDALDGVDRPFDLVADVGLHLFGGGALERCRHEHERQIDVRKLVESEPRVADAAEHEQNQHQDAGKYRTPHADLS
jgi:hypothetical protein